MIRSRLVAWLAVVALVFMASPAAAQTPTPAPTPTPKVVDPADAFFDDTVLHEIRLTINSKDWQTLKDHYLENDYYPTDFRWRDQVVRNIGIRSRGTGSRLGIKPGLRVDFDRYVTGGEFLGLKSFILRNQSQDASNIHERLSMLFFHRMGLPASREAHTRLYVNNQYVGLYSIVEPIDKIFLKKIFNENDGWLYKYDYNADDKPYYFEDRGSDPNLYMPHPFKPETNESDPQPGPIAELVRIINHDSDAIFRQTIAAYLDLQKFIKHIAIETFLGDDDGILGGFGMNNYYLYRFEKKNLFTIIAWDKSNAFNEGPEKSIFPNLYDRPEAQRNRLMMRALGYDDLKDLYLDTLVDCAKSASATADSASPTAPVSPDTPGWLEREIVREYNQIRDAALADPQKPYSNLDFEKGVEDLKTFARQRSDFVKGEVAKVRP